MTRNKEPIQRIAASLNDATAPTSGIMQDCLSLARAEGEPEWEVYSIYNLLVSRPTRIFRRDRELVVASQRSSRGSPQSCLRETGESPAGRSTVPRWRKLKHSPEKE